MAEPRGTKGSRSARARAGSATCALRTVLPPSPSTESLAQSPQDSHGASEAMTIKGPPLPSHVSPHQDGDRGGKGSGGGESGQVGRTRGVGTERERAGQVPHGGRDRPGAG